MKLIRFGERGNERPGVLLSDGTRRDCSTLFHDWDRRFFRAGGLTQLAAIIDAQGSSLPVVGEEARWGAPIARPGKVLCIGLNFREHAKESGMTLPDEPILFSKAPNTVVGPYDDIMIPRGGEKTDWEVELGVVLKADARYLDSTADAHDCIAGFCVSHDVSERCFQLEHGGQWIKGKSCDTFNPLGPYLATPDEIEDLSNLSMSLEVNAERRQNGSTATMVFDVPFLIHYLSQFMTVEAGDLINTGTPPGVGLGMKPPQYLKEGDVVTLRIDHLGEQLQQCRQA